MFWLIRKTETCFPFGPYTNRSFALLDLSRLER